MFVEFTIRLRRRQLFIELLPLSFGIVPMFQQHQPRHATGELEHVVNLKAFFHLSGYTVDSLIAQFGGDTATLTFEEIYQSRTELFVLFSCEYRISVESREQPRERLFAQIQDFHSELRCERADKILTRSPTTICGRPAPVRESALGDQIVLELQKKQNANGDLCQSRDSQSTN